MFKASLSMILAAITEFQLRPPLGIAIVACCLYISYTYGSREKNLPPGPPTIPVLGNLLVFPKRFLHLKFTEWSKQYGDIFSLKVMNKTIIVLNTPTAVCEIIDKRSASSSDRPKSILADMITPHNLNLGTGRYANETWNALRKSATKLLSNKNMQDQRDFQYAEAAQLMYDLVQNPENWYTHIQRMVTSFTLGVVYGCRSPLVTSKDIVDFLHVQPQFINSLEIGRLPPVDIFPIISIVPEPFANWKRVVRNVRRLHETMYEGLLRRVESRVARGECTPGFLEEAIKHSNEWGLNNRNLIMHLGGVLLEGSDALSAALQAVVLALVSFPLEAQKAQEEITCTVGDDRGPTWDDISNLPYTMAFLDETMRFWPVSPLGLPHAMVTDEIVDGVLYPKDAAVFINTWAILHDERYFDRPNEFLPERFLKHPYGVKDPAHDDSNRRPNILFGGGRRVCPGIQVAKSTLELNICNLLWAFNFSPPLDAEGNQIPPDINGFAPGITATPLPFNCRIEPHSAQRAEVIKQQFANIAEYLEPYELELTPAEKEFNMNHRAL